MDSVKEAHGGVQPVLEALQDTPAQIVSSTYYAAKSRTVSARSVRDEQVSKQITQVWRDNLEVYGARKVWHEMNRQGHQVARSTAKRLMRRAGLRGVLRD